MRTSVRTLIGGVGAILGIALSVTVVSAWTGPTASAPNSNVAAPINVGGTLQAKNGDLGVNNFTAFGNSLLSGLGVGTGRYLNFDYTSGGTSGTGLAGYGIRDNAGTLEFKNSGGTWQSLQGLVTGIAGFWTQTGNDISNSNSGNVGIGGAANPSYKLDVTGSLRGSTVTTAGAGAAFFAADRSTSGTAALYRNGGVNRLWDNTAGDVITYTSGGNVGIGTTNPGYRLQVDGGTTDVDYLRIEPTDAVNEGGEMQFGGAGSNGNLQIDNYAGNLRVHTLAAGKAFQVIGGEIQGPTIRGNTSVCIVSDCRTAWPAAGTGGSGTANYVSKFTAATTLGNSIIYDNGTNVGIGTASPGSKLHVNGGRTQLGNTVTDYNPSGANWNFTLQLDAADTSSIGFHDSASTVGMIKFGAGLFTIGGDAGWGTHNVYMPGKVGVGTAVAADTQLRVSNPGGFGVVGIGPASGSAYYGVYGTSGSSWSGLGRADGYSYVGSGSLYNAGTIYGNAFLYLSDKRFKENVQPLDQGLVALMKLRPVSFTWKDISGTQGGILEHRKGERDIGFIAQDVEKILPEIVHTDSKGYKSVDYIKVVPILVEALQEQQSQIDELREEIAVLKKSLAK